MRNFMKEIYRTSIEEPTVVVLDPFDYMIVTYQYRSDDFARDLDSATSFANTGTVQDGRYVGCGQNGGYITPTLDRTINNAYLYQAGDDNSNGKGESIVVNFKSLATDAISLNNDVKVELYAGWCLHGSQLSGDISNVSVTTYTGGTMTITQNVITSNGTVNDTFSSANFPVIAGCCSINPVTGKTHVGTISYNLVTKVSSVVFY